jgi:hypothetical protein
MTKLFTIISFGKQYLVASVVYLGMTCLLLGILPEVIAFAQGGNSETPECTYTYTWADEEGTHSETLLGCPSGVAGCSESSECVQIE